MATFVPKEREILLRHPIMEELKQFPHETNNYCSYGSDLQSGLSERDRVLLSAGYRPQRVEFYTRHNPHPTRVRHMKGLLDVPICCVEDNTERRLLFSPPSGEVALKLYRNLLDSADQNELELRTQLALNKALEAKAPPTPKTTAHSRATSHQCRRNEPNQLNDDQILGLLCQILQTDSVAVCKTWLDQASETEKSIVLNMLRLAASGVISYSGNTDNKYSTYDQQKGVWQQNQSHTDYYNKQPHPPMQNWSHQSNIEEPIVQVARQLSHLASRQSHNAMDDMYYRSPWQPRMRPRSASMEQGPTTNGNAYRRRVRSQSANIATKATSPPPPVSVTVTKQQLQEPQQNRPPTRLRYVSTWK